MPTTERKARLFRQREQELLDAAASLYREQDWHGVPVDAIAARAGVAKGTVYLHVRTKEDIAAKLALRYLKRLAGAWSRVRTQPDGRARLHGLLDAAQQLAALYPGQFALVRDTLTTHAPLRPDLVAEVDTAWRPLESALAGALAAAIDAASVTDAPAAQTALAALAWTLLQSVSAPPPLSPSELPLPDPGQMLALLLP